MLLTGDRDGYYAEFGEVAQLAKAFRRPHVHDGSYSSFRGRRFGARADDVPPERFVVFDQNHDQVGNRALGDRLPRRGAPAGRAAARCSRPSRRCCSWARSTARPRPFQFFSDHIDEEIAVATREGRRREFAGFAEFAGEEVPDPQDPETFRALEAHARRASPRACATSTRGCSPPAARSAPARPRSTTTSTPAG